MKTRLVYFSLICLTIFLTGCWDQKIIQDVYYVGTIGVDYKDNKFETYLQLLDFSTVAKTEQGKPTEKAPIWIVTGSGSTLFDAIREAKEASQQPIVFSHVSSYILTEAALSNHFNDTLDLIRRYPDFRLSGWIFGTKDDLLGILNAAPVLNNSPLTLIEHTPQGITKQFNRIPPLMALDFMREYRDKARTVVLPNLSLGQSWYSGGKPNPLPFIDGAFLFQNKKYQDWFSDESLIGYRWIVPNTKRSLLKVTNSEKNTTLEVAIWKVKPKIIMNMKQGSPEFDIHIEGKATILNSLAKKKNYKRLIQNEIKNEIQSTFNNGIENGIDILQLENTI
ncbi:Ger(x)C family spore germination protein [Niallia sp. JL1B1071]|uniref:Ger(x)C family spore germination protein n=1 Tax=Niallia tiangongensis TaxID=3237105 RepID=UPI0037DD335D